MVLPSSGGHWLWTAHRNEDGYGRFWDGGRVRGAHRVSYELHVGSIDDGMHIDHRCRIRHCVNPTHLEQVTEAENRRRMQLAQRRPRGSCTALGIDVYLARVLKKSAAERGDPRASVAIFFPPSRYHQGPAT